MKNYFVFVIGGLFLLTACNSGNNPDDTENEKTPLGDTTQLQTDEKRTFETIEDYALITSKTELYEKFGAENIKGDTAWYAEGELMLFSSHLTDPNNGNIVRYVWNEEDGETLDMVEVYYEIYDDNYVVIDRQKIKSACGLFSGMTLAELRAWNGEAITFSGFGWDYAGGVTVKPGSKLSTCPIVVNLSFDYEANYAGMESLYGDMDLSSEDPVVKEAPIFVNYMMLDVE